MKRYNCNCNKFNWDMTGHMCIETPKGEFIKLSELRELLEKKKKKLVATDIWIIDELLAELEEKEERK